MAVPPPPLDDYDRFPRMAHWFSPGLLLALLNNGKRELLKGGVVADGLC